MDPNALMAAIQALSPVCQKPEHQALLRHLASQPAPFVELMLKTAASSIDPAQIGALVDAEFGHLDEATRGAMREQALAAHFFLSESARGVTNGRG